MNKHNIYILHEFYTPQHFKAIYDSGEEYGVSVEDYICVSPIRLLKDFVKKCIKKKDVRTEFTNLIKCFSKMLKLRRLENQILIVGLAPYDYTLNHLKNILKRNKCIYFTSCEVWDGSECSRGSLKNKEKFESTLKECFSYIACVSKKTEKEISFLGLPTKVVNHSINFSEYQSKTNCDKKKFIFFGQYIERKGIDFILKWLEENPRIECDIDFFGDGPLRDKIKDFAKTDSRVHERGFISQIELKQILCDYYFSLLPTRREPFGMSIIEAMAAGCPTLAADVIGPSEIIESGFNGVLFQNNDYSDFDEKMQIILNLNAEEYNTLRANSIKSASAYDSSEIMKRWIDIINDVDV